MIVHVCHLCLSVFLVSFNCVCCFTSQSTMYFHVGKVSCTKTYHRIIFSEESYYLCTPLFLLTHHLFTNLTKKKSDNCKEDCVMFT